MGPRTDGVVKYLLFGHFLVKWTTGIMETTTECSGSTLKWVGVQFVPSCSSCAIVGPSIMGEILIATGAQIDFIIIFSFSESSSGE